MTTQSFKDRFNTSKEELAKLGLEFNSEALPLLDKLYNTSFWILLKKVATEKIIKQTFFEAIENCDITKNYADWDSWIHRIWMREILEFYSDKENDKQTVFDFIDQTEVNLNAVEDYFNSPSPENRLINALEQLPAVLRIPIMMKEIHSLSYEKIAELIDVHDGVIATRIYRARKLLYLLLGNNFSYNEKKKMGVPEGSPKLIFDLRRCALLIDDELTDQQKTNFSESLTNNNLYKAEILIQSEIKRIYGKMASDSPMSARIRAKIERKAKKRFG